MGLDSPLTFCLGFWVPPITGCSARYNHCCEVKATGRWRLPKGSHDCTCILRSLEGTLIMNAGHKVPKVNARVCEP